MAEINESEEERTKNVKENANCSVKAGKVCYGIIMLVVLIWQAFLIYIFSKNLDHYPLFIAVATFIVNSTIWTITILAEQYTLLKKNVFISKIRQRLEKRNGFFKIRENVIKCFAFAGLALIPVSQEVFKRGTALLLLNIAYTIYMALGFTSFISTIMHRHSQNDTTVALVDVDKKLELHVRIAFDFIKIVILIGLIVAAVFSLEAEEKIALYVFASLIMLVLVLKNINLFRLNSSVAKAEFTFDACELFLTFCLFFSFVYVSFVEKNEETNRTHVVLCVIIIQFIQAFNVDSVNTNEFIEILDTLLAGLTVEDRKTFSGHKTETDTTAVHPAGSVDDKVQKTDGNNEVLKTDGNNKVQKTDGNNEVLKTDGNNEGSGTTYKEVKITGIKATSDEGSGTTYKEVVIKDTETYMYYW